MCRLEPTKERVERTTLGIVAIEIPHSIRFTLQQASCYEFIVRPGPICGIITSPRYFTISQAQGGDLQQRIAVTDMMGPIFVAIMLRRPEPTKEKVEPTILSTIAIEIIHSARFTLLLLLRIQRYMWRNQWWV